MRKPFPFFFIVLGLGVFLAAHAFMPRHVEAELGTPKAHAFESPTGVLTSTGTSVNNTTTAVPFTIVPNGVYAVQCDAAACVRAGSGSSSAASCTMGNASVGVQLAALQLYDVPLAASGGVTADTLAAISVSGTANCQVWRVVTP